MAVNNSKAQLTQKVQILKKLEKYGKITQTDADKMGIMSLSSRVAELRRDGHPINTVPFARNGRMIARYVLAV